MSRIDDLIAKHCPNGVEFSEIQTIFIIRQGYTPLTTNRSYWENGNIPWFRMEDIRKNGHILSNSMKIISENAVKNDKTFPANSIIISTTATIGEHALVTVPHLANQQFTSLSLKPSFSKLLDIRFVFYYCFSLGEWCLNNTNTSNFASVNMAAFKQFKFPIPPLEIQKEIVKILDTFTKLEAELEAELEARQRQYEYYREKLLFFDKIAKHWPDGIMFKSLKEVVRIRNGKDYKKFGKGKIPVYGTGGVIKRIDTAAYTKPSVLIPRKGSLSNLYFVDEPFWTVDTIFYTEINENFIVPKFFYYFLSTQRLAELNQAGGVPSLTQSVLNEIKIPIPSLEIQHEIVKVLDSFPPLEAELEAELEARRRQYAYYRNRLLTFQEAA